MKDSGVGAPMAQDAAAPIAKSRSVGRVPELDGLPWVTGSTASPGLG